MEKYGKPYQHGDVILVPINALPKDVTEVKPEKIGTETLCVLQRGEASGHLHAIRADRARLYRDAIGLLVVIAKAASGVGTAAELRHGDPLKAWQGDHNTIPVPPGTYRTIIQREYHPAGWRAIED